MVVIDGGCPLMFGPTADGGHKVMCALLKLTGAVPRRVLGRCTVAGPLPAPIAPRPRSSK